MSDAFNLIGTEMYAYVEDCFDLPCLLDELSHLFHDHHEESRLSVGAELRYLGVEVGGLFEHQWLTPGKMLCTICI